MTSANNYLIALSAIAFIGYGASCVWTTHMVIEFDRYKLASFRKLTGYLQLIGAIGLIIGFQSPLIGCFAASGLCLQMMLGVSVRIRIRDPFLQAMPATSFMLLNGYLTAVFYSRMI